MVRHINLGQSRLSTRLIEIKARNCRLGTIPSKGSNMPQPIHKILFWSPIAVILMTASAQAATALSATQRPFDVLEGDRVAHTLCINCHVVDTESTVVRTDSVPSFSWIANQPGLTAERIPVWLSMSHERMPDFSLTRDEIRYVSAYILSLRK